MSVDARPSPTSSESPEARPVLVARYLAGSFQGVRQQIRNLGGDLTMSELDAYVNGDGPAAGFIEDGAATNLLRTKVWHLARVKYFCERFRSGGHVDPVRVAMSSVFMLPHCDDGAHRVLGAHLAGMKEIDAAP